MTAAREPIFNVPVIVVVLIAAMVLIHAAFWLVFTQTQATEFLIAFSFIPARYDLALLAQEGWIYGWGAAVWSFVTYAFLHGDLNHLFFNMVWLLAFGTPVARRFGPVRFIVFFLVTAAAGAAVHLATHPGEQIPMIGASAAISGAMAAALRFVFERGGPLALLRGADEEAYRVPALPLGAMLRNPRALIFIAVWFGTNAIFGAGVTLPGVEQSVAWEAHVGGFLVGLFAFAAFDPVRHPLSPEHDEGPERAAGESSDGAPPIAP